MQYYPPMRCNPQDFIYRPDHKNQEPLNIQSLYCHANSKFLTAYDLRRAVMAVWVVACFDTHFSKEKIFYVDFVWVCTLYYLH